MENRIQISASIACSEPLIRELTLDEIQLIAGGKVTPIHIPIGEDGDPIE